ncbi:unnamed protein product [Closterium sp. NIES-54]
MNNVTDATTFASASLMGFGAMFGIIAFKAVVDSVSHCVLLLSCGSHECEYFTLSTALFTPSTSFFYCVHCPVISDQLPRSACRVPPPRLLQQLCASFLKISFASPRLYAPPSPLSPPTFPTRFPFLQKACFNGVPAAQMPKTTLCCDPFALDPENNCPIGTVDLTKYTDLLNRPINTTQCMNDTQYPKPIFTLPPSPPELYQFEPHDSPSAFEPHPSLVLVPSGGEGSSKATAWTLSTASTTPLKGPRVGATFTQQMLWGAPAPRNATSPPRPAAHAEQKPPTASAEAGFDVAKSIFDTQWTGRLTERREPASRPVSPVRFGRSGRRVPCSCQPAVPGTHLVVRRPSSPLQSLPLPSPPASSLPTVTEPESDRARAAHPTVTRLLATVVTDPSFESTAASALVAELVDFAAACRLDYAASLVVESKSVCPPSVGGECALGTDVLEDRQEDLECLATAAPHLVSMLFAPEGDPDAPDIPTPRSYAEAIVGSPPVFKARYVARGFSQREGVDLFQTFSPTPKMTTLRVLLHVAAQRDYELHSLDFSTAFLQGSLHEEIWLRRPPGFTGSFPSDLGELRSYLGLQITRDRARRTITLNQSHMVHQVLLRFGFTWSSAQATPPASGHWLSAPPSDESVEPSGPYPELVRCLMYLMTYTRPDLAYPLGLLARCVAPGRHRKVHMDAAKRVLRYLCSTSGMGLVLGGRGDVVLTGHSDASWVHDQATQRSSQGYTFSLGSGSVSWCSTRSSSVLSSSCEAEIYATAMAAQELRWLTYLLTDLGERPRSPPVLYVDNKAAISLCQEHRLEHITKHIALCYFLARELQQRGQLRLAHVATRANTTDIFTKALPSGLGFESQCVHFGHPSAGGCQRSIGDPRLILGKGYMLVVVGGYGRTDPLLNKPFYPNGLLVGILTWLTVGSIRSHSASRAHKQALKNEALAEAAKAKQATLARWQTTDALAKHIIRCLHIALFVCKADAPTALFVPLCWFLAKEGLPDLPPAGGYGAYYTE